MGWPGWPPSSRARALATTLPPPLAPPLTCHPLPAPPCAPAAVTPMWRTVSGLTYCNADGLRLKRKLGLL